MNGKKLAEMAVDAIGESMRLQEIASDLSGLVKRSIARQAQAAAAYPDTLMVREEGILVPKVAEWTDEHGATHYIVYYRPTKVKSIVLRPTVRSSRKRSTHELYRLPAGHLYEHFKPFMEDVPVSALS